MCSEGLPSMKLHFGFLHSDIHMPWTVFLSGGCGQKHGTAVPTGVVGAHEKGHPQARRAAAPAPHE